MVMARDRERAGSEFRRMMKWIAICAVAMVALALGYLELVGDLTRHAVIATILGVFFSVLLGSGLFALAFFSDKSGHDAAVDSASKSARDTKPDAGPEP
jgi:membrane-bound ClpP family serine protease